MNTRQQCNHYQPLPSLTKHQKGVYYFGIKSSIIFLHTLILCLLIPSNLNRLWKILYICTPFTL